MTPNRLKLVNFLGIFVASGKTEIEIDFDTIVPSSAQLVALVGPNGASKTTILDNMHPYRLMPSHATSMTPNGFSYYDHVRADTDAVKELDWTDLGRRFRSVVRVRSTRASQKQECYLFVQDNSGNYVPFRSADGVVSNGSTGSYDKLVEEILGPPEVFFTARFRAQGREPFSAKGASEIKSLLSSMLRFDRFAAHHAAAKSVCDGVGGLLLSLQRERKAVVDKLTAARTAASTVGDLAEAQRGLAAEHQALEAALVAAEREHAVKQERLAQQASIRLQREAVQVRLNAASAHASEIATRFDSETESLAVGFNASIEHANSALTLARQALKEARGRHKAAEDLAAKAATLGQTKESLAALRVAQSELRWKQDELGYKPERVQELREGLGKLREQLASENASAKHLSSLIDTMRRTAAIVQEVPCAGTDFAGACKLLAEGNRAAQELPGQENHLEVVTSTRHRITVQGTQDKSLLEQLLDAEAKYRQFAEKINANEEAITNLRVTLADEARIHEAVAQLQGLATTVVEAEARERAADAALLDAQQKLARWSEERKRARAEQVASAEQSVKAIALELAAMPPLVEQSDIATAEQRVGEVRRQLHDLSIRENEGKSRIRAAEQAMQKVDELEAEIAALDRKEKGYSVALARWNLLHLGLGKNGIIAMELDDASPAIAAHTNALLDECYGGRFSVQLVTQKATAKGVMKEDFEILVYDNLRGGDAKPLGRASGGEKVWINETLVSGIALYMATLGGKTGGAMFSDEVDGTLDDARKRQFLAMKRAGLRISGCDREYLITHTPALWDECDARIDVTAL